MLPVPDALATVLVQTSTLAPRSVPLAEAAGLILAEDVAAPEPLPPFRASIKDGYAVIAADGPGEYPMVGEITAGQPPDFTLTPGAVAYITTGAPLPSGADAVVMVEETTPLHSENGETRVRIQTRVQPGADVRGVGADIAAGERVLAAGERLGPAEIGLLATVGASRVTVYPRPRVAVLSTGDELVEPHQALGPGQIRDSNRATLMAAARASGGIPVDLGIARDEQRDLEERVERGLREADVLLTSGGVSMGELDLLKPLLENAGQVHFGRVLMKPGKPLTFATATADGASDDSAHKCLVFALPGNPVSSLVTYYLFAVPALRKLAGWPDPHLRRVRAQLAQSLRLDPQRPEYHRATLRWENGLHDGGGGFVAESTGSQASSRLLSMRTANALLELPARAGELPAGSVVDALVIGEIA
jgi:gephyrin